MVADFRWQGQHTCPQAQQHDGSWLSKQLDKLLLPVLLLAQVLIRRFTFQKRNFFRIQIKSGYGKP
jgi:hypothetical protein